MRVRHEPKDETVEARLAPLWLARAQQRFKLARGAFVCVLERHQAFEAAVLLYVVQVHGQELEHLRALFQAGGQAVRQMVVIKRGAASSQGGEIFCPELMLALEQGKQDFVLVLEVVVHVRAPEGDFGGDLGHRDVVVAFRAIEGLTRVDDLDAPRFRLFLGDFRHRCSPRHRDAGDWAPRRSEGAGAWRDRVGSYCGQAARAARSWLLLA